MKKYRGLIAFLVVCGLSALVFYLSGLPLERGMNLAQWACETLVIAGGAAVIAQGAL